MSGRPNSFEELAQEAAERLDLARAQGQQLSLLADNEPQAVAGRKHERVRGRGKALSQMREFLAAQGYRLPEEALAQMAGLASREDAVLTAMVAAERVVSWAFAGAEDKYGNAVKPTPAARLRAFETAYTVQLRALDALMPYGLAKVSPDGPQAPVVQVNVVGAPQDRGDPATRARDVTPVEGGRMMPADAIWEIEQNQSVGKAAAPQSDGADRTDEASD